MFCWIDLMLFFFMKILWWYRYEIILCNKKNFMYIINKWNFINYDLFLKNLRNVFNILKYEVYIIMYI